MDFDLSAASWRNSVEDERGLMESLAIRLESALPSLVQVVRKKESFFSKRTRAVSVSVRFDSSELRLSLDGRKGLLAEKSKIVRDICLKTDAIDLEAWLSELSGEISEYAKKHESARSAIDEFLFS